jgi:hypothetical protein
MNHKIPNYVKPFLWSYNVKEMDWQKDKKRILTNVLNLGTKKATDWVFSCYSKQSIIAVIKKPLPGEWNKKSLNFWSLILNVKPGNTKRKLR